MIVLIHKTHPAMITIDGTICQKRPHHLPPLDLSEKTKEKSTTLKKLLKPESKDPFPETAKRIIENFETSKTINAKHTVRDLNLTDAISSAHLSTFITLSENLEDIDTPIQKGGKSLSCLSWAILANRQDICRYLIELRGANINKIENIDGIIGPLTTYYASLGDTQSLQILVERFNADVNQKDSLERSPLNYLLKRYPLETSKQKTQQLKDAIHMLADYDADLEERDQYGNTPLILCVQLANLSLTQLLASHFTVDTQTKNNYGKDALTIALDGLQNNNPHKAAKYLEIAKYLAQVVDTDTLKTKLIDLVYEKNEKACALLLELGKFNIDEITDEKGNSLLLNSTIQGDLEQVKMLLKLGANVHFTNHEGKNAFFYAQEKLKDFLPTDIDWISLSRFLAQYMVIYPNEKIYS